MLASDPNGSPHRLGGSSLASDIVELVIFTTDDAFLQTLREAVGGARRLWNVPSSDKVSDLLLAGQVGILVLDVQALQEAAGDFVAQIKRQFPDLVVVVAGNREAETALANLISGGTIYRFIHKPMSPGRAKMFVEAAVRKYEEQRRRAPPPPARPGIRSDDQRRLLLGAMLVALIVAAFAIWALRRAVVRPGTAAQTVADTKAPAVESPLLARAGAALAANRLTAANGDDALDYYLQASAANPADAAARAGIAEVHERLLARAENALLEERLDEAAAAIDTARKAGVESGRIVFLTAQLAKSREQLKAAVAQARLRGDSRAAGSGTVEDRLGRALALAAERIKAGSLLEPERDNARYYVQQALILDPNGNASQAAKQTLAIAILENARAAIDRREFDRAATLLNAADGIAAVPNVENARSMLNRARIQADSDAWAKLLNLAQERLQQDRLIEPPNDSAKYYLSTLREMNPGNPGLPAAIDDLGSRLVAKARRALNLRQTAAARSWLDEAAAIGYSSTDAGAALRDIDAVTEREGFLANVMPANQLTLVKSSKPTYPRNAEIARTEGWVELDFTVTQNGAVEDIAVHAANPTGVFDKAAMSALAQWRYQPVMVDGTPVPRRCRMRMRFALTG